MTTRHTFKVATGSIATLDNLSLALGVSHCELENALSMPQDERYTRLERHKADGSVRSVYKPHYLIRLLQRRINHRILANPDVIAWPSYLFGSIPSFKNEDGEWVAKDYVASARLHCGAKSLLKMDIKDFFDNIHSSVVEDIFLGLLNYPGEVAKALTNICTYNSHLAQGALTSSYIANMCLHGLEDEVFTKLSRKNLRYSRFVDDITVSSVVNRYDFSYVKSIIEGMLLERGLPVNSRKTKVQYSTTEALTVHGLRVCFPEPRLPSDEVRRIRAAVKNVEMLAQENGYRMTHAYRRDFNKCMGRVNKLSRVSHKQHGNLVRRLVKVYPLPSKKDISRARSMVARLERDYLEKRDTYWYSRRFYIAHERLNILKRSYKASAIELRGAS
ncbi:reverse transcriptase family protein [Pseudomonas aeruginosa]|nr:reverse transcriptase family protein [Pseudomonas aeruginosa]